jgi:hypothetical protein
VSSKQLWFGNDRKYQWVPAPLADAESSNTFFVEEIKFENGGGDARRSAGFQKQYTFNFNAPVKGAEQLGVFNKFASGFYGDGLIRFADPYTFETNMLSPAWASPGLVEQGWPNFYTAEPTFADTAANSYDHPYRTATWTVTGTAATAPAGEANVFTIPVTPGYTLHLGVSGSVTGDGKLYYQTVAANGTLDTPTALTFLATTSATRLNTTIASTSAVAVRLWLGRSATNASTVTITSILAQLWPTTVTPTLTGNHIPGDGHTGLLFQDEARVETYVYINPPRKALSTSLIEVGGWRL